MASSEELALILRANDLASSVLRKAMRDIGGSASGSRKGLDSAAKGIRGVGAAAKETHGLLGGFSGIIKTGLGVVSGLVAFRGIQGLKDSLKGAIEEASNLGESMGKMRIVFAESGTAVEEWSKTSDTAMGLSQQAAVEMAATYGNLFTAMGMGKEPAATMSMDLVRLAADLTAFNNVPIEEVLQNLRSGLVGEAEPMRKFGVLLNEDRMKAQALAMGFKAVNGQFTEGQKVQARYAMILNQTKTAQGNFALTSQDLAQKQRTQVAQAKNLAAELGQRLLPIQLRITEAQMKLTRAFSVTLQTGSLREGLKVLTEGMPPWLSGRIDTVADAIEGFLSTFTADITGNFQKVAGAADTLWKAIQPLGEAAWDTIAAGLDEVGKAGKELRRTMGGAEDDSNAFTKALADTAWMAAAAAGAAGLGKLIAALIAFVGGLGAVGVAGSVIGATFLLNYWIEQVYGGWGNWLTRMGQLEQKLGDLQSGIEGVTIKEKLQARTAEETAAKVVAAVDKAKAAYAGLLAKVASETEWKLAEKWADTHLGAIWNWIKLLIGDWERFKDILHLLIGKPIEGGGSVGKKIPNFAGGGIVPGPIGMPRLVVAHGGESIGYGLRQGGGNVTINMGGITVQNEADENRLIAKLQRMLATNLRTATGQGGRFPAGVVRMA